MTNALRLFTAFVAVRVPPVHSIGVDRRGWR